jgi:uncharacterized membrane protein YqjE
MVDDDHHPALAQLAGRLLGTSAGTLRNRGELLLLEWQQEKARLIELLILAVAVLFLGIMALMLLTATIIFLFPEDRRLWAAAGFTVLYLGAAIWAVLGIKSSIKQQPFAETLNQVKKDGECLQSLQ